MNRPPPAALRATPNRHAWFGLALALLALAVGSTLACYVAHGRIDLAGLLQTQRSNPAIWLLDAMPFVFMAWGQYIGRQLDEQRAGACRPAAQTPAGGAPIAPQRRTGLAPATHLPDRQDVLVATAAAIERPRGPRMACALLALGTDQHSEVELALGADAAREFAEQLAARMQNVLGNDDVLAHLGADRFAILMPRLGEEAQAVQLASRIRAALDTPLRVRKQSRSLRVTIGIALHPAHGSDAETLLRRAELARAGAAAARRECLVFDAHLEEARDHEPRQLAELHAALSNEGLEGTYRLQRAQADGASAPRLRLLPYWVHPRAGRLQDCHFLNLPLGDSLLHGLSLWLLSESVGQFAHWRRMRRGLGLVVRLPDAAFARLPVGDMLFRLLASHDLPTSALTIELGPRALLEHNDATLGQLATLRGNGVRIALADVGSAMGSPALRLDSPFDEIRLDPALVARAVADARARTVLHSHAELARRLELTIVASGVDNEDCAELARQLRADYAEGELISPPLAASDIAAERGGQPAII
jgi:diguanylate cyclase (GGDEF)-like protein